MHADAVADNRRCDGCAVKKFLSLPATAVIASQWRRWRSHQTGANHYSNVAISGDASSLGARWAAACSQSAASSGRSRDDDGSLANVR